MNLNDQDPQSTPPEYRTIKLTQGQVAIIDAEDYEYLNQWKWIAMWDPKTQSYRAMRTVTMSREIMKAKQGEIVDHMHHNTLDNRKSELRTTTAKLNSRNRKKNLNNTSGFKGVSWYKKYQKWMAYISVNNKRTHLGYFTDVAEAHQAYQEAAVKLHGEFARFD